MIPQNSLSIKSAHGMIHLAQKIPDKKLYRLSFRKSHDETSDLTKIYSKMDQNNIARDSKMNLMKI